MDLAPLNAAARAVAECPLFPGAVLLYAQRGEVLLHAASGYAVRYEDQLVPMRPDTIFDLASITKLFTSTVITQLAGEGALELDTPVARYLPEFGKPEITVRRLLTHTSGLAPTLVLWHGFPDVAARIDAVWHAPARGNEYCYSDLNMITLGVLAERVTESTLDSLIAERITRPLGMTDTGFGPVDRARAAATEVQTDPPRGLVHGEVHDENAWALGGVAGHAGLFGTARDLLIFASQVRPDAVLGFEVDQPWFMGELTGPRTVGHTGFTGTSLVIDLDTESVVVLLTNRVHPSRNGESINPIRALVASALAKAYGK